MHENTLRSESKHDFTPKPENCFMQRKKLCMCIQLEHVVILCVTRILFQENTHNVRISVSVCVSKKMETLPSS